ncbi:glycerophosphodiester phosphodiesterase family protein [Novosphingobium aquae]|uniref:Glycerophosphodiester phosphodiesterase family protein n=1 Tax=Novosphingobium aquae TaxID=3133435 RepID=A0ABU8S7Z4_9SPHN
MSEYDDADDDLPPPQNRTIVWLKRVGMVLALLLLILSFVNASWLAPIPRGTVKLVAHRGTSQQFSHKGLDNQTCTATRIEPPVHDYLENTLPSLTSAVALGAQAVEVDIALTTDGRLALFHDWTLDCRTDGKGEVRSKTMAELKALDPGYGYTADGGKTFPLRSFNRGQIPALEDALAVLPDTGIVFNFKSRDAREADQLAAALKFLGRDVIKRGDGFLGTEVQAARIRKAFPGVWAFSKEGAKACTKAYLAAGWFGLVPDACKGGTLFVPLNYQWAFPGWPNRTLARMNSVGARVVLVGPMGDDLPMGLDLPEQIGKVPASFTGYLWVDDIYAVGPALRPYYNKRSPEKEMALAKNLEARRKARE